MASFPMLQHAARASEAEALRVWGRGGYPKRALYLRRAAQQCLARHDGALPRDEAALLALPGVGPFTAAIVLAFGFGIDSAAVDTNVTRLFGRLVLGDLQPARESSTGEIRRISEPPHATRRARALESSRHGLRRRRLHAAPTLSRDCPLAHLCAARPRFAAGERAEPVRVQPPFSGSQRELRGMLMQVLRRIDSPIDRDDLLRTVATESGRPIDEIEAALTCACRRRINTCRSRSRSVGRRYA